MLEGSNRNKKRMASKPDYDIEFKKHVNYMEDNVLSPVIKSNRR